MQYDKEKIFTFICKTLSKTHFDAYVKVFHKMLSNIYC